MKHSLYASLAVSLSLVACNPVDRSSEQPFAPSVSTLSAAAEGPRALLTGAVTASPNSRLAECGFNYGNDTLRLEAKAPEPAELFAVETDDLEPGRYFAVAYARNGVGTSRGDTLYFEILPGAAPGAVTDARR